MRNLRSVALALVIAIGAMFPLSSPSSAQGASPPFNPSPSACQWSYAVVNGVNTATYCGTITWAGGVSSKLLAGSGITLSGDNPTTISCQLGTSTTAGCVPPSGGGVSNFYRADGTWASPGSLNGQAITPSKVNGICYIDGTTIGTLAAAFTACPSNVTIIIPSNQTISAAYTITGANVKLKCENNAVITWTTAGNVTFAGTNSGVEDCTLNGPGTGTTTSVWPVQFTSTHGYFRHNIETNFGEVNINGGIVFVGAPATDTSYFTYEGNTTFASYAEGLYLGSTGTITKVSITDNYMGNGVEFIPQTGSTNKDIVIANNIFTIFSNGNVQAGGCIEMLGGLQVLVNVSITGNVCLLEGNAPNGGDNAFAFGGMDDFTITGNIVLVNGFHLGTGAYLYEFNGMIGGTISGNYGEATVEVGYVCENCQSVSIVGNVQNGTGPGEAGIMVLSPTATFANQPSLQVIVSNNVLKLNGASTIGINFQCITSQTCHDFIASNNEIIGDGSLSTQGIVFNPNGGTMLGILSGPNIIRGIATGVNFGAGLSYMCEVAGANYATTPVSLNSNTSVCQ